MERIEREIALLREFRTRLVADVVTGQVDVRAVASVLPNAPEEAVVALSEDFNDKLDEAVETAMSDPGTSPTHLESVTI